MYKLTIVSFFLITLITLQSSAQTLTNNGAYIFHSSGSTLLINGDFENLADGSINNSGSIFLTGNWTNNAISGNFLQGSTGNITFNGSSNQTIGGTSKTWFNNIDLQSETELAANIVVSEELQLSSSSITLNNSFLTIENTATITGYNSSNYIIAEGNGKLVREVGSTNVYFPVGTISSFSPVIIKNDGVVDNFGVNVFKDVRDGGSSGNTIPEIDHCVIVTWDIFEETAGGSDLSITPFWSNANEGSLFDRSVSGIGHYNAGNWEPQAVQDASGSAPYSITRTGITNVSTFAVGDINSPMVIQLDLVVDLSVFLEGPFNGSSMNTDLNVQGLIPLAQPYNTSPWNYPGTEQVVSIPNANIVDWVFIELRDAITASAADETTIVARQAGFLLTNGTVVAIDGASSMQFEVAVNNALFVVVYHRNHIGIISSNPLPQTDGNYAYNFTTDAYQAYGSTDPQKEIVTGIFGMYGGDLNVNGAIGSSDYAVWQGVAGTGAYLPADANLDGQIDNSDKNDIVIQNIGEQGYIPE